MEITFEDPVYLLFLFSIPLLIVSHFYFLKYTKKKAMKFANFDALKRVTGEHLLTKNTQLLLIRILTVMFLVLSISGPVFWYVGKISYNDYVITIDASASMASEDIPPNRLAAAKDAAVSFISGLDSKTQVGVLTFAGVSFVDTMLTSDMEKVKSKINAIDLLPAGGTDIGSALINSANMLLLGRKAKTIILITDGTDTAGFAVDEGSQLGLDYIRSNHIVVHTIGIGTEAGGSGGLPSDINLAYTFNKEELQKIASDSGGRFYEAKSQAELDSAFRDIASQKTSGKIPLNLRFGFLAIGLILIFVEWGLINTRFRFIP